MDVIEQVNIILEMWDDEGIEFTPYHLSFDELISLLYTWKYGMRNKVY